MKKKRMKIRRRRLRGVKWSVDDLLSRLRTLSNRVVE
jgi:hypothetical protein